MKRVRSLPALWLMAAATLIPIGVLSWLGIRVLQQDGDAERQRQSDNLQVTARRLSLDLAAWLQELDARVLRGEGLTFNATGPESHRDLPLLYSASFLSAAPIRTAELAAAEMLEYQKQNLTAAADAYRRAARSNSRKVRAAALLGLGVVLLKSGDLESALGAYRELESLSDVDVAGRPAALVALNARCRALDKSGERARLRSEATTFARTLHAGGWLIDRPTFENYQDDLRRWGAPEPPVELAARTRAAIQLWQDWHDGKLPPRGQRIESVGADRVLATWATTSGRTVAWLTTANELDAAFRPLAQAWALRIGAYDDEDRVMFGDGNSAGPLLTKSETRLPFSLRAAALDAVAVDLQERKRRRLLLSSLAVAFALITAAAFGLYRTTVRQLALARQQTDFVSAVSHEFRTPLTSMRHLTDLLSTRHVTSEERRTHYYKLLTHETERLHRLVEDLLSFGRIDAGGYAWRLQPVDIGTMAAAVCADFKNEPQAQSREIVCAIEPHLPAVRADSEALSRALWNLLDNASKYSAADAPVSVSVRRAGQVVHVAVGDQGIGIRPEERESVFHKFVRGTEAKHAGIGGVGIGLTLVSRIIEAHGGSVQVDSEPGRGSTFTLVIPCIES